MTAPLVSICIPAYNGERWLRECLASALRCTAGCEILLVDDCSTDRTVEIARELAAHDPRLTVVVNDHNLGLVGNWNRCLLLAKGKWIKFLFQDDTLGEHAIERMLEAAGDRNMFVAAHRNYVFEPECSPETRRYYTEQVLTLDKVAPGKTRFTPEEIVALAAAHPVLNFIGEPSTVMFRRELVDKAGQFNTSLQQVCDLEYWLRVAGRYGLLYVPHAWALFRVHGSSVSAQNVGQKKYVSTYLDPLRVVAAQLYAPAYDAFRKHLSRKASRRLKLWLRLHACEALLAANGEASRKALEELFREQPELRRLAKKPFNRVLLKLLEMRRKRGGQAART